MSREQSAPKTELIPGVQGFPLPEDHGVDPDPMAHEDDALGGVFGHGAFEEDDPATWDTRGLG
jgi:hypothetical protein